MNKRGLWDRHMDRRGLFGVQCLAHTLKMATAITGSCPPAPPRQAANNHKTRKQSKIQKQGKAKTRQGKNKARLT